MRTVRIIADTVVSGVPAKNGDVVRVDDADARLLIECAKAIPCEEPDAEPAEGPEAPAFEPETDAGEDEDKNDRKKRRNR